MTVFSLFRGWLRRSFRFRPDLHFLMYTRKGCHLCDEAWDTLLAQQKLRGFALEKIDIESSPELVREHGKCVPVVLINGTVRFRGRVNNMANRLSFVLAVR